MTSASVVPPLAISTLAYVAVTALLGRELLANLSTTIAADGIDPLLNAAILLWNTQHVPWTDAWYQFPIFYPASDALTFSEHLLGLSVITTPIYWATRDAIAAYNLTFLLTYVLSGMAMFALVWRLTGHGIASFLSGLAYLIAPYRASQIAHIQALAVFWAPLALLGLHAFLETRRRRWLVLFAVCWLLQGAAYGYYLVFFSVLVGLWGLWFVIGQRRWRDAAMIAAATIAAVVPLAPILLRYVEAHARYQLTRNIEDVVFYSADVSSIACAVPRIDAWAWLNEGICGGERELFPGLTLLALCGIAAVGIWVPRAARSRAQRVATTVSALLLVSGAAFLASATVVALGGPWRLSAGPISASASSVSESFTRGVVLVVLAAACSPAIWRAARSASIPGFYLLMAPLLWAFTWGPAPALYGKSALDQGPYTWLMLLPGVDGLRVASRFWGLTVLCLCVATGVLLAAALRRSRVPAIRWVIALVAACGLLVDGFSTVRGASLLPGAPRPDILRGGIAVTLPIGVHPDLDVAAQYEAVRGGWVSVNGHSGHTPPHYPALANASQQGDPAVLLPFLTRGDLNVIVSEASAGQEALFEGVSGAELVGTAHGYRQYRIPQQGTRVASKPAGARIEIASVSASCFPDEAGRVLDGDDRTRWQCGAQRPGQTLVADLRQVVTVGQVVPAVGRHTSDFPRGLLVETSPDGEAWQDAWNGGVRAEAFEALATDARGRIVLSFHPRMARYVRLQLTGADPEKFWSVTELEVWSGSAQR